ncbi:MAG: hypothetical protein DWP92_01765 [Armatimonadetes bacterium]|nr:MAG: hypothetical protein DWP92_01765 [Armatimonadota bacterium]
MNEPHAPVVLIGVGEMGGVFARALLKAGHTVVPVTRSTPVAEVAARIPEPMLVLITVGEDDLSGVLESLPTEWKEHVVLIQNELLPRDWVRHGITDPTVGVIWFEKKKGSDTKVIVSSPFAGPKAQPLVDALIADQIDAHVVGSDEIIDELVAKNLYILVANIAGLETGGSVGDLWDSHEDLARKVGTDVLAIQEYLVGSEVDADAAYRSMVAAFDADPEHGTTGRSAPRRLQRALSHASDAGIEVATLTDIARAHDLDV